MNMIKKCFNEGKTWDGRKFFVFIPLWIGMIVYLIIMKPVVTGGDEKLFSVGGLLWQIQILMVLLTAYCCVRLHLKDKRVRIPQTEKEKEDLTGFQKLFALRSKHERMKLRHFLIMAAFAAVQYLEMDLIANDRMDQMKIRYMLLGALGNFIIMFILLLWLNSFRLSLGIWTGFSIFASLVFYYVFLFKGEPLQMVDLLSMDTAMEIAGSYYLEASFRTILAVNLAINMIAVIVFLPEANLVQKFRKKILIRIAAAGLMVGGVIFYYNVNWNGTLGIVADLWAPLQTYQEYGTVAGFFAVGKYTRLRKPEGYSADTAKEIASTVQVPYKQGSNPVKPVNIICIMNESWADFRLLGDIQLSENVMEYYDSMKENTIKGYTLVSIRGGGTAKPEYEFLTGNSVKQYPGMVPFVSYFTHEEYSVVSTLKDQGYQAIAMHPAKGSNWNRNAAYELLGFEQFYTIEDFDQNEDMLIRQFISDRANYDKIISLVERKKNPEDPLFLFDVTMQNHGGYGENSQYEEGKVRVSGSSGDSTEADTYFSLLKETDTALEHLITFFSACEEPTLICMFGDHMPALPEAFFQELTGEVAEDLSEEQQEKYYMTPFFIWANYDIPEAENVFTSTNFMSTLLLEQTGLEMPPYLVWEEGMQEKVMAMNHLGFYQRDGSFFTWENAPEEIRKLEWKYEVLQYNNLGDQKKRMDGFFTISGKDTRPDS